MTCLILLGTKERCRTADASTKLSSINLCPIVYHVKQKKKMRFLLKIIHIWQKKWAELDIGAEI